jgi:tetratricopeptide (TPR) repeat protein
MAQQRFETARQLIEKALVDHPRAPDRFNGRLQLARCYQELARSETPIEGSAGQEGRVAELVAAGEALLLANIDGQHRDLEPTAWEWRRSLFMLGALLHETGRYDEAISRFHEAVRRYPEDQEAATALYLIADSYLQSAKKPAELLAKETAPRGQALLRDEMAQRLEKAKKQFGELSAILLERQTREPLRPEEETYLRNCYFGIGEVSMTLEDWPAAIDAYTTAANRYQDRPDALIAYVQIANAYWRLGKDGDARGTLRQARWILRQMDEKVFAGATLTKEQWTSRLESLVGGL